MSQHDHQLVTQTTATQRLLDFCVRFGYDVEGVNTVRACLDALERGDPHAARQLFKQVPLGGMGCFNDWIPAGTSVRGERSNLELFDQLILEWSLAMQQLPSREDDDAR